MPRDKGAWSSTSYHETKREIRDSGRPVTDLGEQRARQGRGLDRLVDPRTFDCKRQALDYLVQQPDGRYLLKAGIAMPVATLADTTGSMGGNVELIFDALPRRQHLLAQTVGAALARYQDEHLTGAIQDRTDQFPFEISQFEPDNEIDRQMRLLVPEKDGGDAVEDYQLAVWYLANQVEATIWRHGLKGYAFIVGDMIGRDVLDPTGLLLDKVFGRENRHLLGQGTSTEEICSAFLQKWHGFFLQVGDHGQTTSWWTRMIGRDRVVILPRTEDLPEVQAVIVGLTEGTLDLQNAQAFLTASGHGSNMDANRIVRAVSHIPLRAQANLPGFNRIPLAGAVFASQDATSAGNAGTSSVTPAPRQPDGEIKWQL